jgi:hypothetical protein
MIPNEDFHHDDPLVKYERARRRWAFNYAQHKAFCIEYFEGRADTIFEQAKLMQEQTMLGPIEALDICMQIEAEFPKRVEEFVDRSGEHPGGRIIGLIQYMTHVRTNG